VFHSSASHITVHLIYVAGFRSVNSNFFIYLLLFFLSPGITSSIEGKISKPLKKLLKKLVSEDAQEELAVSDTKLGNIIKVRCNNNIFSFIIPHWGNS
jgi:hypothetical protein